MTTSLAHRATPRDVLVVPDILANAGGVIVDLHAAATSLAAQQVADDQRLRGFFL